MEEIIKGFKYHSISKEGVVKNNKTNFIKKNWLCGNGYFYVDIQEDCVVKKCPIHRLLAIQFIPNLENKRTVNHKDGNKLNNNVSNLEWCSDSENLIHARNNGLLKTKINNEIAEQIKNENGTIREIAKKYGIGKTQVGYIKQGKRWQK